MHDKEAEVDKLAAVAILKTNQKELFGNEPPVIIAQANFLKGHLSLLLLLCNISDIMRKKQLKMTVSRPFGILFLQNLSWVILVRVLTFCSICMVQLFCFLELRKYYKITQIENDH